MTAPAPEVAYIWVGDIGADVVESHAVIEVDDEYVIACGLDMACGHFLNPAVGAEGWIFIDRACEACFPNQSDLQGVSS